ncbi:MAG TPA: 3-dehydroquinate synthase [Candidatus Binatia bacterium]|nr:3-dehydroquinate synthase [Candidatus Binatia bacterium]
MSDAAPIIVSLGSRSYAIHVGDGMLDSLGSRLKSLGEVAQRVAIVTNPTVHRLYGSRTCDALTRAGFAPITVEVPDGEEHKNLAWLAFVYDKLIEARIERASALIALGGGVIGDLTGFAAATYLRGISYVQVPTTLVAQIDAAIGGKTAVNLAAGKNLIGAFHQPRFVIADTATLRSLPDREYVAGLSEVVKTAVILSRELFDVIDDRWRDLLARDATLLTACVRECAQLKALVVAADETESDYRAILNFGHTLGHAVETLTEYKRVLHGEAVAIGMTAAIRLSIDRSGLAPETGRRVIDLLDRLGLPTAIPAGLSPAALALAAEADKKRSHGKVKFVCLEDIGRTRFEMLTTKQLENSLAGLLDDVVE